jgi:hypothetical protein
MADTVGEQDLRKEYIDATIKAIALREYVLKDLCTIESSNSWTETYFRETNTDPTDITTGGGAFQKIKGVPRLAPFPFGEASWTKVSGVNNKYACEGLIAIEDELMSNISVIQRTLVRIARAPVKAVDDDIAAAMLANAGNVVTIAAGNEWDSATVANRTPIKDILDAVQLIRADNLNALGGNGYICLNGVDYTNFMTNATVLSHPTFKSGVMENGVVGEILGMKIKVTDALEFGTPDKAYVVIAKEAMTWKTVVPLTTMTIEDPGVKKTIRAWELGQIQVVVPNAIARIDNTRK